MRVSACPRFFATTSNGTPFITACEAHVWRRIWKLISGLILARVHASAMGRACSDFCHAPAIAVAEDQFMSVAACTMPPEESCTLHREHHMARLAALTLPDCQRAGIGIEVARFQLRKLAVA